MTEHSLKGLRILVVEDEYLIADDLRDALIALGAEVIGPVATVTDAVACVDSGTVIDAAVLDVNLRGEMIYPVADALSARDVHFIFATGYDSWSLPDRFSDVVRLEKPLKKTKLVAAIRPPLSPV